MLLSAVFLHLLPEANREAAAANLPAAASIMAAVVGAALFAGVDRSGRAGRSRVPQGGRTERSGAGFVGHGWIEGATIGVGLQVSTTAGMLAALTVAIHHLCEGLALVCYLPARSRAAPRALVAGSRGARALAGALMGSVVRVPASLVPLALGLFAGLFLFASVSALRYGGKGLLARLGTKR